MTKLNKIHLSILLSALIGFTACGSSSTSSKEKEMTPTPSVTTQSIQNTGVHIDEFMASNINTKMDRDYYAFSDWIELFNNSNQTVNLSGYYLSDDPKNPKKWRFPPGYLLVWADKKDRKKRELHTNFKLSSKKESIIFSDRDGNIIDNIRYSKQTADISAGPSNQDIIYMNPTPGTKNSQAYTSNGRTNKPHFSQKSGFYNGGQISLDAPNGAKIYYTTDGSIPTKNSNLYTSPININKTTIINAIALEDGIFPSEVVSHSYIINDASSLPVVSIALDPKYLYDDMVGIYVDGKNGKPLPGCMHNDSAPHNFAQKWERPAYLTYFDKSHNELFTIGSNIAISGQCSRYNRKKSFKLKLDSKYGTSSIKAKIYPDKNIKKIKDFKLRTGNRGYEIGDILAASLASNGKLDVDYQSFKTVRVYLDGEYWGVYNFRETKNANFIKNNHPKVDKDKLDIIKNSLIVKEGSLDEYKKLNNISTPSELKSVVDVDNFIDYVAMMLYSGNEDWSYSNCRVWRENKPGAKWRWMLDDLDEGFNNYNALTADNLNGDDGIRSEDHELAHIFNTLMSDPAIKAKFKQRFYHLLDTTFSPENVNNLANAIFAQRAQYVPSQEPKKWFQEGDYNVLTNDYVEYKNAVHEFANKRRDIVRAQLDSF